MTAPVLAPPAKKAPDVAFRRLLFPADDPQGRGPTTGDDVKAVKIVVSRLGFWPLQEFDKVMNNQFAHGTGTAMETSGLEGLQQSLGVEVDGVYGEETHDATLKAIVPIGRPHAGEWAWDGHAMALYESAVPHPGGAPPMHGSAQVQAHAEHIVASIFDWWEWMVEHTAEIGYRQFRPLTQIRDHQHPPNLPFDEDCSSAFVYCAFLGGALSPDQGNGYTGFGNTDSMIRFGMRIEEADLEKFCRDHYVAAFYGSSVSDTEHMTAVRSRDQVYSMGREEAPERHDSFRYRNDFLQLRAYEVV